MIISILKDLLQMSLPKPISKTELEEWISIQQRHSANIFFEILNQFGELQPDVLGFNLTESGLFCVLPWLTMPFSANLGGWIADTLVSKGTSVTTVRKADKTLRDIYNRATRNCPWIGELWVRFMLYLERCLASEKEISDVYERSLQCTCSTIDEYVDIFLTRVDGLRRRILSAKENDNSLDFGLIRDTFQRACDYLSPQLKNTYSLLQIHSYWARLESNIGKDITAARGVWESLLKNSGTMMEAWQGYISMETEMGHVNEARSIYKRCYTKRFPGTGSEDICNSWIRFERKFGTLEDFDHASQKVTPRLQELQFYRIQQESKVMPSTNDQKDKNTREKRKPAPDSANEQLPAKYKEEQNEKMEFLMGELVRLYRS